MDGEMVLWYDWWRVVDPLAARAAFDDTDDYWRAYWRMRESVKLGTQDEDACIGATYGKVAW